MLRFVVHDGHRSTMLRYLEDWAGPFRSHIELVSYDELLRSTRLPAGVHVFTDLERVDAETREGAAHVWTTLRAAVPELGLLNHPLCAMQRYELLRTLYETGLNQFDVYRLTEARRPARYPVFLRGENDHAGPESALLSSKAELEAAIEDLCRKGQSRDTRIAVEFCAEQDADGCYRKYAAFFVDGVVIPRHIMFAEGWLVKGKTKVIDEAKLAEERAYMESNPHEAWIRSVFELAHIDYGRIDYTVVGDRPQAYEINTNPTIVPAETTLKTPKNEVFTGMLTAAFAGLEARNTRDGRPAQVAMAHPVKTWTGRLAARVLARVLRRQLRPLV